MILRLEQRRSLNGLFLGAFLLPAIPADVLPMAVVLNDQELVVYTQSSTCLHSHVYMRHSTLTSTVKLRNLRFDSDLNALTVRNLVSTGGWDWGIL